MTDTHRAPEWRSARRSPQRKRGEDSMVTRCALLLLALSVLLMESGCCCCHTHCLRERCCEPCCRPSCCCEGTCNGYTPVTTSAEPPAYFRPIPASRVK